MNNPSLPGVSVIVCCYNSVQRLPQTLRHLANQSVPENFSWEIIIVDNSSTDNTAKASAIIWRKLNCDVDFRIVKEVTPGLIYARKRGVQSSRYEVLIFCDDDNWLSQDYISKAYERLKSLSNVAVLGGSSVAVFETQKPEWFDHFEKSYAVGKILDKPGYVNERKYIAGAGMVIRKSHFMLLNSILLNPVLTGRKGRELLSGEDAEMCLIFLFLGFDLYYDPSLTFKHYIPENRVRWDYCNDMISKAQAIPQIYFQFYQSCYSDIQNDLSLSFDEVYRLIFKRLVRRFVKAARKNGHPVKNLRYLFKTPAGSAVALQLKSEFNKVIFLLKNKRMLRENFKDIYEVMVRIRRYKENELFEILN
ncbi:MAG: glycosyltransferase [Ilyomonas sp.]